MRSTRLVGLSFVGTLVLGVTGPGATVEAPAGVRLVVNESERRVDVLVDGQPFTAYIWPTSLKKPVLYPLRTASGTVVTRGYPLQPRPGERVDHPHHVGLWFNHGDVNGLDFWNNSEAIPAADASKYGTIVQRAVKSATNGKDRAQLDVSLDWQTPRGQTLLREDTRFVFHASPGVRAIDRLTTLSALDERVTFKDSKEGSLGLRVARQLEQPSDKAEVFTDANGQATSVPKLDNRGVSGKYASSAGLSGNAVWGTRGRWALLAGTIADEAVTIAILDHPTNPSHPAYWHARGYGLFAANPFGRKSYDPHQEELSFSLAPKQSVTLRYRVLILSAAATAEQIEAHFRRFVAEVK